MPVLAGVDRSLRAIAMLQAAGLVFLLVLVILFARWLLQPYRRLLSAAGQAPGSLQGWSAGGLSDGGDELVRAFQGVLDKLRGQERELISLNQGGGSRRSGASFPGEQLIGGMTSAVLVFDAAGRLAVMNAAAGRLLGLDRQAVVGRPHGELLKGHPRLVSLIEESLKTGRGHSREVLPLSGPSGQETHLGAMISPIRPMDGGEGGVVRAEGAICLLTDLTEIKSLRERVGLKENLASLGELSAGIAHEFRNSLATIQGYARLIAKNGGNGHRTVGSARENAGAILREVEGVKKIVADFLRYARPAELDLAEVDLERLVRGVVADFEGDPASHPIAVTVEGTFPRILADETLLRQALHNLLRNADDALRSGNGSGGEAGVRRMGDPRIVLRGVPDPGSAGGVRLTIEDNGPGIPQDDVPRIFTPFFTTKDRGTGLGLALVQKAVALHDGQVEVESEQGSGARITLVLPARPGQQDPPGPLS
jgi:PAS domain S-box-containing protein